MSNHYTDIRIALQLLAINRAVVEQLARQTLSEAARTTRQSAYSHAAQNHRRRITRQCSGQTTGDETVDRATYRSRAYVVPVDLFALSRLPPISSWRTNKVCRRSRSFSAHSR